eukprot:scaffold804_cov85-Skeletonema_dohrnii-CCMP3373.AAC.4
MNSSLDMAFRLQQLMDDSSSSNCSLPPPPDSLPGIPPRPARCAPPLKTNTSLTAQSLPWHRPQYGGVAHFQGVDALITSQPLEVLPQKRAYHAVPITSPIQMNPLGVTLLIPSTTDEMVYPTMKWDRSHSSATQCSRRSSRNVLPVAQEHSCVD